MKKNKYFQDKILWLVFILFVVIGSWLLINHHPWRDEAQAWLIARDLPVKEIILQMPYEGTPPLWHLVITPFAKFNFPYESILGVHFLIAITSIFILLFYSPFPKAVKILLSFNYYFIFEYAIIARNYNLTILLLFFIASLYHQRFKYPILYGILISLLSWSNVHSLAISAVILALFVYDLVKEKLILKNSHLVGIGLALSGITSAIIIMMPYSNQVAGLHYAGIVGAGKSLALAAFPFFNHSSILPVGPIFYWLIGIIWLPIIFFLISNNKYKLSFALSWLWLAFIFTFKHSGDLRHYGLVLVFFMFFWWLDTSNKEFKNLNLKSLSLMKPNLVTGYILLIFILLSGIFYSLLFTIYHQGKYFSGAKEMADYLKTNNLTTEEITSYPSYIGASLLPYLPNKNMYQFETLREGTFLTWDKTFSIGQNASYHILKNEMKKYYQNKKDIDYVLLISPYLLDNDEELELIAETSRPTVKRDEYLYLYRCDID